MAFKKHVPNIITLCNLASGLIALDYAYNTNLIMAFVWVCIGIFFDFWDGFFARLFKAQSPIGLQLDSLADMVTSGVVPGVAMFKMLEGITQDEMLDLSWDSGYLITIPFLGFIIKLASCYRLAKFNVDTRQKDSFIGLPTPANALFIMSPFMLNSEIPLFSLKVKYFNWETNKVQLIFLIVAILLLFFFQYLAIPLIILFYVVLSAITNKFAAKTAS